MGGRSAKPTSPDVRLSTDFVRTYGEGGAAAEAPSAAEPLRVWPSWVDELRAFEERELTLAQEEVEKRLSQAAGLTSRCLGEQEAVVACVQKAGNVSACEGAISRLARCSRQ